jgi:excinuclease ABC subunit C
MATQDHTNLNFKDLPALPGIYIFRDKQDNIIYVGKAASLRNRVSSYFQKTASHTEKTRQMVEHIDRIEFVVTESEIAALILECQQIKKYRPHYNILLKDDKSFPYIKIDVADEWPTINITRRRYNDGAKYIGRVPSAWSARQTYEFVKRTFPFRSCSKVLTGKETRPCLKYHIRRCPAPCIGCISRQDYIDGVRQAIAFLEGREEQVLRELRKSMQAASTSLQFEKAAQIRDQVQAIEAVIAANKIPLNVRGEIDAIALAREADLSCIRIFSVREARLSADEHFFLEDVRDEPYSVLLESFIQQYYSSAEQIPGLLLLQYSPDQPELLSKWLKEKKGAAVELRVPARGAALRLVGMVAENAQQQLEIYKARRARLPENLQALSGLKELLSLPGVPQRIEAYDISNMQGTNAVGSMVVFENGAPKPSRYRRFRIKSVLHSDDYAMMREMIKRRFAAGTAEDETWKERPGLVLIDGGMGHLHAAMAAMAESGVSDIPVISIAKQNEDIYKPGKDGPIAIPRPSAELHLLQRIRDEAHRFAVTYHRTARSKQARHSVLDSIAGIGPSRRKALIKRFGSVHALRLASLEDITSVKGVTTALARKIIDELNPERQD